MKHALAVAMSAAVLIGLVGPGPAAAQRSGDRGGIRPTMDRGRPGPPPAFLQPYDARFHTLRPVPAHPSGLPDRAFTQHRSLADPAPFTGHHRGFKGHGFKGHGHGHGSVIVGSGPVVYWPGYAVDGYTDASLYAAPQYVVAPPPPTVVVVPSPPAPTVVEHDTGRYELRGDGITTPYTWVWVPKPPAAPPEATPASTSPHPAEPAPPRRSALYTWTDRDGVVHWTDNAGSVPQEYRSKVQKRSL